MQCRTENKEKNMASHSSNIRERMDKSYYSHERLPEWDYNDYKIYGSSKSRNESNYRNYFYNLIDRRKSYLESLRNLEDDWISGESSRPSVEVINLSKKILDDIKVYIELNSIIPPKLILGPKPIGGITIELIFDNNNSLNINLYNQGDPTIEQEIDGYYNELDDIRLHDEYSINDELERMI